MKDNEKMLMVPKTIRIKSVHHFCYKVKTLQQMKSIKKKKGNINKIETI